jgi:hypothetical protein
MKHPARSFVAFGILSIAIVGTAAFFGGCGGDDEGGTSSSSSTSTTSGTGGGGGVGGSAGGSTPTGGAGGEGGTTPQGDTRQTISGDATWVVTFDATAQQNGATNCSYTRHYEGVQDESRPWICPTCEVVFHATVQMTQGQQDCFTQVSEYEPNPEEWIGYDSNGTWWRSAGAGASEQGAATVTATTIDVTNTVTDLEALVGGTLGFDVTWTMTVGSEQGDPMHGWVAADSYSCSWPKGNPPAYTGAYTLAVGQQMPDGLFRDQCDDIVRLHDLLGTYLVVFMSATDCGPCQQMANGEAQFIADMAAQSIDVEVVTLLCPSLDNPLGEASQTQLNNWVSGFNLSSPVMSDRGWGLTMFVQVLADQTAYPSWMVVDPNGTVLDVGVGATDYSELEATIVNDNN